MILRFTCIFYHWLGMQQHSAFISNYASFYIQIEASANHVNEKRMSISFLPNDPAAASFLEVEQLIFISVECEFCDSLYVPNFGLTSQCITLNSDIIFSPNLYSKMYLYYFKCSLVTLEIDNEPSNTYSTK